MIARINGFEIEFKANDTQQDGQRLILELENFIYGELIEKSKTILKRKNFLIQQLANTILGFGKHNGIEPTTIDFKIIASRK